MGATAKSGGGGPLTVQLSLIREESEHHQEHNRDDDNAGARAETRRTTGTAHEGRFSTRDQEEIWTALVNETETKSRRASESTATELQKSRKCVQKAQSFRQPATTQHVQKRRSMPDMLRALNNSLSNSLTGSNASLGSDCPRFRLLLREQQEIFHQLDRRDGCPDGRISRTALIQWLEDHELMLVSPLNLNPSASSAHNTTAFSARLVRMISQMDDNKDGTIDKEEFACLMEKFNTNSNNNCYAEKEDEGAGDSLLPDRVDGDGPWPTEEQERETLLKFFKSLAFADEYHWWPPPLFLLSATLLQVGFFIFHAVHLTRDHQLAITWSEPAPRCSALIYNPYRRREAWRYASYALVHSGFAHILLNIIVQLAAGLPLEMSHGGCRVAAVYLTGVVGGSLATAVAYPRQYLVGASGGVYALIFAHPASLILNWKEDATVMLQRLHDTTVAPRRAAPGDLWRLLRLVVVLLYMAADIGVMVHVQLTAGTSSVGYMAHVAGAVSGFFVGLAALHNRRRERWEAPVRAAALLTWLTLIGLAIWWNIDGNNVYQAMYHNKSDISINEEPLARMYFLTPDYSPLGECDFLGRNLGDY